MPTVMRKPYKILITSQKGGVGKSTLSVNLAAYFNKMTHARAALVDLDHQATSSKWLHGVDSQISKETSFNIERGASSGLTNLNIAKILRNASQSNDIVVTDLTWNDLLPKEFFFDFDFLMVPCSLSSVEIDSTVNFLERISHIINSKVRKPPTLIIVPSRIRGVEDYSRMLRRTFNFEFLLSPPVTYSAEVQDYFCNTFLFDSNNEIIKQNFIEFARSIEALVVNATNNDTRQTIPQNSSRDSGTILDRFLLNRSASKQQPRAHEKYDMPKIPLRDHAIPSFLSLRK
jgi:cellulose biosynthesis protein BcsQ